MRIFHLSFAYAARIANTHTTRAQFLPVIGSREFLPAKRKFEERAAADDEAPDAWMLWAYLISRALIACAPLAQSELTFAASSRASLRSVCVFVHFFQAASRVFQAAAATSE